MNALQILLGFYSTSKRGVSRRLRSKVSVRVQPARASVRPIR